MRGVFLDSLSPTFAQVGYGRLGVAGDLGYEHKRVVVHGQGYSHALSTHPPARLHFRLRRAYSAFACSVALNDDVPAGASSADFAVLVDGTETAQLVDVRAGEPPRALRAMICGADSIDLIVRTRQREFCHAVWLDPLLEAPESAMPIPYLKDCLERAELALPRVRPRSRRCIATVVSPGFESYLDDLLGSLYTNGRCGDASVVVFVLDGDEACHRITAKYGAHIIEGRSRVRVNSMTKAVLYSAAAFIDAEQFLCLDADMLVLGDLSCLFGALESCPTGAVLVCREGNNAGVSNLGCSFGSMYRAQATDATLLGITQEEQNYSLVVNDGLFAASRQAMLSLDAAIRAMTGAVRWVDARRDTWWRNQFVFNLALARLQCGVEIDPTFNLQLHVRDVQMKEEGVVLSADWLGRAVRVLHFSGAGKQKYAAWRGRYARVPDPIPPTGAGDAYSQFVAALRTWIGRYGTKALVWSFYGKADASTAHVPDSAVFPLFAALHYLIRSNGCIRVLESGTARGVSAACLASAVAHRAGCRVVTLDPNHYPERDDLWHTLPAHMQQCIEPRMVDGVQGMQAEIAAGAQYDAILLDSIHEADHVWNEFQAAAQLVRPRGLILIHDPIFVHGTVPEALKRIEDSGFGVVRLWAADSPVREDDHLGLALIENRRRLW